MSTPDLNNQPFSATLILDKPFVEKKTIINVSAGQSLRDALKKIIIKPGMAYVILINGQVVDQNIIIQPGDQIRCLAQITGGMS